MSTTKKSHRVRKAKKEAKSAEQAVVSKESQLAAEAAAAVSPDKSPPVTQDMQKLIAERQEEVKTLTQEYNKSREELNELKLKSQAQQAVCMDKLEKLTAVKDAYFSLVVKIQNVQIQNMAKTQVPNGTTKEKIPEIEEEDPDVEEEEEEVE